MVLGDTRRRGIGGRCGVRGTLGGMALGGVNRKVWY